MVLFAVQWQLNIGDLVSENNDIGQNENQHPKNDNESEISNNSDLFQNFSSDRKP